MCFTFLIAYSNKIYTGCIFAHRADRAHDNLLDVAKFSNQRIGNPKLELSIARFGGDRFERQHGDGYHSRLRRRPLRKQIVDQ